MTEDLLTQARLAKRWDIQSSTLRIWRWNGNGPQYVKIGRKIFYRLEDVKIFEQQKIRRNTSAPEEVKPF